MSDLKEIRRTLERQRGKQAQIEQTIETTKQLIKEKGRELRRHEQAREIIKQVGLRTQEQLQYHISDITSLALTAVFDDPYQLVVNFAERRNKTECDLLFERNGEHMDPLSASGGGAVDVAAFALRIASWSMQRPKGNNTIILDEPMRFLSEDKQEKASRMIKELSLRLGLQFIIITHEQTLTEYADRIFTVTNKNGKSRIDWADNHPETME